MNCNTTHYRANSSSVPGDPTRTLLTFEQFEQLPERPGRQELLEGELIEGPPPVYDHDEAGEKLCDSLKAALVLLRGRGFEVSLGKVHFAVGYRLGDAFLIPDVRIDHPDQRRGRYLEGAPALAVEIVSESNTARELNRKVKDFLENGAREVSVIYPADREVWIHQPGGKAQKHSGKFQTALLPSVEIDLDEILGAPISYEGEAPSS